MNATAQRTRPRGFAAWNPRPETLALVGDVETVLADYRDYLPLTIRQVFYRLVSTRGFLKSETAYARLCEAMNRARRAGRISFADIRDDGTARHELGTWKDEADFLESLSWRLKLFHLDRQEGQPVRLWVLCEAGGMAPMLARVANPFGVPVLTSGGFDSLTAKHDLAHELAAKLETGVRVEILHLGDLDPSGEHLFTSLAEDVEAMCKSLCGTHPEFTRLAVTREQADRLNLPTAPAKATDRRRFTGDTVQCEAIAPDVLTGILRDAILKRCCAETAEQVLSREAEIRAALAAKLGGAI